MGVRWAERRLRQEAIISGGRPDWFGQPRGLTILFLTEMWDQFSFYGMRALLVLYMTKHLMMPQSKASWVYGVYAAFVYLTPMFGGIVSDRWLTRRTAIITGGLVMAAGHFMMAFEPLLLWALATIAIGNGLFLPSLPSQIDGLYAPNDPRRKSAYNVYYVGVNVGAFLAPMVIGTIGEVLGFHWGFAAAGVGMIVALITYVAGSGYLPPESSHQTGSAADPTKWSQETRQALRERAVPLLTVMAAVVVFRGAYEQLGNTIPIWLDQTVNRNITPTFSIPVTWFQSLNPLLVFVFSPYLVMRWTAEADRNREPATVLKMVVGVVLVALAYLLIAVATAWARLHAQPVGWGWAAAFIAIMTAGELFILPVGLGLFARLAPSGLTATVVATWFFAGFAGNLLAGWLGTLWNWMSHGLFLALIGGVALLSAGCLTILSGSVTRLEQSVSRSR
jgi:proton-dependent oligopeptide transporter, POT family